MVDLPEILSSSAYHRAVEFHGHECPGLAIGFRAALLALDLLGVKGQQEEEIVALVETDSCAADAIQVLTGCTFGKGNLLYKDFGKMALTLGNRKSL
jgi:formylmethanofuran dehydrogenase subunit E